MIQENLSVMAYANGFTLWHYTEETGLDNVLEGQFFVPVYNILNVGDMILVNAGKNKEQTAVCFVTDITSNNVGVKAISK